MTVKRRRKSSRTRGSRTCGYGLTHRGAGNRGGRGRAGSGKKGKCKMPAKGTWSIQFFGKTGFKSKGIAYTKKQIINLRQLEELIDTFVSNKNAVLENGAYVVSLTDLGIDKLLSSGRVTRKLRITVVSASGAAIEKVKAAGGEVVLSDRKKKLPDSE